VDTYILNVYQRDTGAGTLAGRAERVPDGTGQGFASAAELWAFLLLETTATSKVPQGTREPSTRTGRRPAKAVRS